MANENDQFRPIRIFGYVIFAIALVSLIMSPRMILAQEIALPSWFVIVAFAQIPLFLIGGIGIIMKARWGYYLLNAILFIFFFMLPVGTIISIAMWKYMEKHSIKLVFGGKSITP